jgi:hypothetical protein
MKQWYLWLFVALFVVGLVIGRQTRAAGEGYTLVRGVLSQSSVVAAEAGSYQLRGSVGQPFIGKSEAGEWSLSAGHWYTGGGTDGGDGGGTGNLYLPMLRR